MKKILPLLILSTLPLASPAQSKLSPSLRQLLQTERTSRGTDGASIPAYIFVENAEALPVLEQAGVQVGWHNDTLLTARIPATRLAEVASLPGVRYVQGASSVRPQLDKARAASGTDLVRAFTEGGQSFDGRGVVIGVVDAGFDYRHPAFRTTDGTGLRISRVWEQSLTSGTPPEGFTYGGEFTSSEELLTAMGDVSTNSHGTHVATIAAGRDCGNGWYGVAPEAELVLVSKGGETTDNTNLTDAIAYIFQYARSQGKPCVVNLSLGTQEGPHDGTSAFDQTCDALQGAGCLVVGSVGNFGASPIHVSASGTESTRTFLDFKSSPSASSSGGTVDVWGNQEGKFAVQVSLIRLSTGEVIAASDTIEAGTAEGAEATLTLDKSAKGEVRITTEVNPLNHKPHALISIALTSLRYNHALALTLIPRTAATEVDAWADDVYVQFTDNEQDGYTDGDTRRTLAEIGGTGKRILSVGSWTTRREYTTAGSSATQSLDEEVGNVSSFSAAGPALDGRTKPDLCAPGCYIISAVNSNDVNISSIPLAGSVTLDGTPFYWGYMQGTSMAAPFVAGTVATLLQADPSLTPETLREALQGTAAQPTLPGVSSEKANRLGAGMLDAYAALKHVLSAQGIASPAAAPSQPFTWQRTADGTLHLLFTSVSVPRTATLYDLSGRALLSAASPAGDCELTLPAAHLPAGTYLLQAAGRTVKVAW